MLFRGYSGGRPDSLAMGAERARSCLRKRANSSAVANTGSSPASISRLRRNVESLPMRAISSHSLVMMGYGVPAGATILK